CRTYHTVRRVFQLFCTSNSLRCRNPADLRSATCALKYSGDNRQWHAANIKGRDQAVGKGQACASDCFISAWACHNSLLTTHYASAVTKPAKQFHIFHQRHLGKSANINKCSLPAEHSMIPASDSEQHACVMRESVREPINGVCWQVNAEIAAGDGPVIQYPSNFR